VLLVFIYLFYLNQYLCSLTLFCWAPIYYRCTWNAHTIHFKS